MAPNVGSPRKPVPAIVVAVLIGIVSAGLALGVGELVAGVLLVRSPVIAVGDGVIHLVPQSVKELGINLFGTNDKLALVVGILSVIAMFAAVVGRQARRSFKAASVGVATICSIGLVAAVASPDPLFRSVLPAIFGAAAGIGAIRLFRRVPGVAFPPPATAANRSTAATTTVDRRQFLRLAGGLGIIAAASVSGGRWISTRLSATASRAAVLLPAPLRRAPAIPAGAELGIVGLSPFTTPNSEFYRIDTALLIPQIDAQAWALRIKGMVNNAIELTFDELLAIGLVEEDVTLTCVSNDVGGDLVGNARWLGVPLKTLLDKVGVDPEKATQVVGRSVDGYTCGFPTSVVYDGRTALVAVGMNGEPLPIEHGFPARLVTAGLYGYVSATKWLREIELTTLDAFDSYWVPRGWSKEAPIKTEARIDTPHGSARLRAGNIPVAGVAWAQPTGIARVEVQIDNGDWKVARLSDEVAKSTWRQWVIDWDAEPGRHVLSVRATDQNGRLQTEQRADSVPNGATGWHTISVNVAA